MIKLNFNKKVFFTYIYYNISHNFTHSITIYKDLRLKNFIDILYYFFQLKKKDGPDPFWARSTQARGMLKREILKRKTVIKDNI